MNGITERAAALLHQADQAAAANARSMESVRHDFWTLIRTHLPEGHGCYESILAKACYVYTHYDHLRTAYRKLLADVKQRRPRNPGAYFRAGHARICAQNGIPHPHTMTGTA